MASDNPLKYDLKCHLHKDLASNSRTPKTIVAVTTLDSRAEYTGFNLFLISAFVTYFHKNSSWGRVRGQIPLQVPKVVSQFKSTM